jgi:ribosomal silencing factor RsfS
MLSILVVHPNLFSLEEVKMNNSFILDLQTYKGVREGLTWMLGNENNEFENILAEYMFDEDLEMQDEFTLEYIEDKLKIDWDLIDLKNLFIKVYHFTTRANKEESFDDIYNLYFLLSNDTEFREFFKSHAVEFDLKNSQLKVCGKIYDLLEVENSNNEALEWIHTKLYIDPEIWGFVRVLDIRGYNSDFPERPEFITHVAELMKDGSALLDDWKKKYGNPYVIEFKQPFYSVQILNDYILSKKEFMRKEYLDEEEFENMKNQYELELKRGLFSLVLAIFMDNVSRYGISDLAKNHDEVIKGLLNNNVIEKLYGGFGESICAVVPKNSNIHSNGIIQVWEFEEFQKWARVNNGYLV